MRHTSNGSHPDCSFGAEGLEAEFVWSTSLFAGAVMRLFVLPLETQRSIHADVVGSVTEFTIFAELATLPESGAMRAFYFTRQIAVFS